MIMHNQNIYDTERFEPETTRPELVCDSKLTTEIAFQTVTKQPISCD